MAKQFLLAQATSSRIEYVRIADVNGSPITGLLFNSTGLLSKYVRTGATSTAITLITQTVTGAYSSGGFVEIDATAFPGLYRIDIPNTAFASGVDKVFVSLYGFAGMNPSVSEYELTAFNPQDAAALGLTNLDTTVSSRLASTGQLLVKKNAILTAFTFPVFDSGTHQMATGKTITAQVSIDGGALGACTNAVTEISGGLYKITLAAADTNGTVIALKFSGTGCDDLPFTLLTQP